MDRMEKFIRLLGKKDRYRIRDALRKIVIDGDLSGLDVLPLQGYEGCFRCRIGTIRIIFERFLTGYRLMEAGFRKDVYKRLKR